VGVQVHRLLEELEAAHLGHAMVGEHHGYQLAAELQLAQRLECLGAGLGPHHPVGLAVVAPEVARHRARHPRVVVDGQQDWLPVGVHGHAPMDGSGRRI
jgi:hypothetical protein